MPRRLLAAALSAPAFAGSIARRIAANGRHAEPTDPNVNLYSFPIHTLEGQATNLSEFSGKVTLLVNVASYCGKTPQYTGLERLQQKYADRGFSVLGFPSNDFGAQEPGTPAEIREFCSSKYQVTFPLFEKVQTKQGGGQAPVYAALEQATGELPSWNFAKYLIGRDGKVLEFFGSGVKPEDPALVAAIERALAAPAQH